MVSGGGGALGGCCHGGMGSVGVPGNGCGCQPGAGGGIGGRQDVPSNHQPGGKVRIGGGWLAEISMIAPPTVETTSTTAAMISRVIESLLHCVPAPPISLGSSGLKNRTMGGPHEPDVASTVTYTGNSASTTAASTPARIVKAPATFTLAPLRDCVGNPL
jgi:hypothetical protein